METEVLLTKSERNNEWNVNFFQDISHGIQSTISSEFSICRTTSEISFRIWREKFFESFDYTLEMNFQFKKEEKVTRS